MDSFVSYIHGQQVAHTSCHLEACKYSGMQKRGHCKRGISLAQSLESLDSGDLCSLQDMDHEGTILKGHLFEKTPLPVLNLEGPRHACRYKENGRGLRITFSLYRLGRNRISWGLENCPQGKIQVYNLMPCCGPAGPTLAHFRHR